MNIEGNCVFEHCYFSGPINKKSGGINFFIPHQSLNKNLLLIGIIILAAVVVLFYSVKKKRLNYL